MDKDSPVPPASAGGSFAVSLLCSVASSRAGTAEPTPAVTTKEGEEGGKKKKEEKEEEKEKEKDRTYHFYTSLPLP